jgi:hypothetical protein
VKLLWRLMPARHRGEIAQLEAATGTTQRGAVDYAMNNRTAGPLPGWWRRSGVPTWRS